MARKIFRNTLLISLTAILAASLLIVGVLFQVFSERNALELRNSADVISKALQYQQDALAYLNGLSISGIRITWIATDGTVLFDNQADAEQMENHANRPEVQDAMISGMGQSQRYSATLAQETNYYALRLDDQTVLRTSITSQSVFGFLLGLLPAFLAIVCAVLLLSLFMASRLAKRTLQPINNLDLEHPENNDVYEELSPLLSRVSEQNMRIDMQLDELKTRREELTAITQNMSEGLVMLNADQHVLSINRSVQKLFCVQAESCIGKHVLTLSRDLALEGVVHNASKGNRAETLMEIGARVHQVVASPVRTEGEHVGTVLLLLDITERAEAERMRREFSANVSHELKTPLTSISGYAEIMKNGVAKPEDMKKFASRIYDESNRLIELVEDILQLSKLDEGRIGQAMEDVDLKELANDVKSRLSALAEQYGVRVSVKGEALKVHGVRMVLEEMVFNLAENAIKYNKRGGLVDIVLVDTGDGPELSVRDNGIGIPLAHQDKVFERFYRVDKSHSRESGSTGLGLSIVKHGARFHGARVMLSSAAGTGTTVKLTFPRASLR